MYNIKLLSISILILVYQFKTSTFSFLLFIIKKSVIFALRITQKKRITEQRKKEHFANLILYHCNKCNEKNKFLKDIDVELVGL